MVGRPQPQPLRRLRQEVVTASSISRPFRQGDPDWLHFVNTTFNVAMYGHQYQLYDAAFKDFFGLDAPTRTPGFPFGLTFHAGALSDAPAFHPGG